MAHVSLSPPFKNLVVCSPRFYAKHHLFMPQLSHELKNKEYRWEVVFECPEWEAYVFDSQGRMSTVIIQEWAPKEVPFWRRLLRSVWRRL